jgi:hypothetical protein
MDGEDLGLIEDAAGGAAGAETEVAEEEPSGEETAIEGEKETETEEPGEGEGQQEEGERASRALPTQLRKALREFVTGNPEFAQKYPRLERQLTAALFKAQQSDRLGGLQALRAANELMEAHGGREGIAEMAEQVEASNMMQEGIHKGDPVFIEVWARESPEGFAAAGRPYLDKLQQINPVGFDRAISKPLVDTLTRGGVFSSWGELKAAIAGERFAEIQRHFQALDDYWRGLHDYASRSSAPDPLKGEREEFDQERQEFQNERVKAWYGDVRSEVNNQMMAMVNRLLRQELAGKKLRVETANRLRKQINEDLAEAVNTAPGYKERYEAVLKARDHGKAVRFIVSSARQKVPSVIKRVLRDFNLAGGTTGTVRRVAAGGSRGVGSSVVAGRPKTADVDFGRTDKTAWLGSLSLGHGEAWLKNGKRAKW